MDGKFGTPGLKDGVTPGRKVQLVLDGATNSQKEPTINFTRMFNDIGQNASVNELTFVRGYGFTNRNVTAKHTGRVDRSDVAPIDIPASVSTAFLAIPVHKRPSEKTGALTGASASLLGNNTLTTYQQSISAIGTFIKSDIVPVGPILTKPMELDDYTLKSDFVWQSTSPDNQYQAVQLQMYIPSLAQIVSVDFAEFYFNGPATKTATWTGTGRYCLQFTTVGLAYLIEFDTLDAPHWVGSIDFMEGVHRTAFGNLISVTIVKFGSHPDATRQLPTTARGLHFIVGSNSPLSQDKVMKQASTTAEYGDGTGYSYKPPSLSGELPPPCLEIPLKLRIKRDCDLTFTVSRTRYKLTGKLTDSPFYIPHETLIRDPLIDPIVTPLRLSWYAYAPPECSVTCELYKAGSGTPMVTLGSGDNHVDYEVEVEHRYQVVITLTGTTTRTPVFFGYTVTRDPINLMVHLPEEPGPADIGEGVVEAIVTGDDLAQATISIYGAGRFPHTSSAVVSFVDRYGKFADKLSRRSRFPIRIETIVENQDGVTPPITCVLFRGYISRADRKPKPHTLGYPDRVDYVVHCKDLYNQRMGEAYTTSIQNTWDATLNLSSKVSDLARRYFQQAGFPDEMLDIRDDELRQVLSMPGADSNVNAGTSLQELVEDLYKTYLSDSIWMDYNGGDYGKIRTVLPNIAPYVPVAAFLRTGSLTKAQPMSVYSYGLYGAEQVPACFIVKNSYSSYIKAPEFNHIIVSTTGVMRTSGTTKLHVAELWNPEAIYTRTGAPNQASPDYTDGSIITRWVPIPSIGAGGDEDTIKYALQAVARRIFLLGAHAVKKVSFTAPLILIEHELEVDKLRPPKYYDPIYVGDDIHLLTALSINIHKSFIQMAHYEAELPYAP